MKIMPTNGRLMVESDESSDKYKKTESGLIIEADTSESKIEVRKVIAVAQGLNEEDVGRAVVFNRYSLQSVKVKGTQYCFVQADDVIAVVEGV